MKNAQFTGEKEKMITNNDMRTLKLTRGEMCDIQTALLIECVRTRRELDETVYVDARNSAQQGLAKWEALNMKVAKQFNEQDKATSGRQEGREDRKDRADNQDVFNALAELEQFFFYKKTNPDELSAFWPQLAEMHEEIKTLLCQWHNLTGCDNP